jgi:Rrf2 family protein
VLQQLSVAGLVTGRRGVKGGYRLARPPSDIALIDIVQAVGQVSRMSVAHLGSGEHPPILCALNDVLEDASRSILNIMGGKTLGDLLRAASAKDPSARCNHQTRVPHK